MNSQATDRFWQCYHRLPADIQSLAVKRYRIWRQDPHHPSLQFKKVAAYWSARVTDDYRALGIMDGNTVIWFWIGTHGEYEQLLGRG